MAEIIRADAIAGNHHMQDAAAVGAEVQQNHPQADGAAVQQLPAMPGPITRTKLQLFAVCEFQCSNCMHSPAPRMAQGRVHGTPQQHCRDRDDDPKRQWQDRQQQQGPAMRGKQQCSKPL